MFITCVHINVNCVRFAAFTETKCEELFYGDLQHKNRGEDSDGLDTWHARQLKEFSLSVPENRVRLSFVRHPTRIPTGYWLI